MEIINTTDTLYTRNNQQTQPVRVYLDIYGEGRLSASIQRNPGSRTRGSRPAEEMHGMVLAWEIPPMPNAQADTLLAQIAPIARRIIAGSKVELDASKQYYVGEQITDDAKSAVEQIAEICSHLAENRPEMSVKMDLYDRERIIAERVSANTTDAELATLAVECVSAAHAERITLTSVEEYLQARRDDRREFTLERIVELAEEIRKLEDERNELLTASREWSDPTF